MFKNKNCVSLIKCTSFFNILTSFFIQTGRVPRVLPDERGLLDGGDPPVSAPYQDHGAIPGRKFCPPQANRGNRILDPRLHERGAELATQFR